jgi:uncharacterized protein YndB with AHSA1/START domain
MPKEQLSPDTSLTVRRTFQAPRERVFRAWTNAQELARWFAPSAEYSTKVPELDLKVGGKYKVEMHHKGGNIHTVEGTYREIKPPEKIAFTWRWESDAATHESLVTIEFLDQGSSTEILLTHAQLPSVEEREKHAHGWNGCLEQLARFVEAG